MFCLHVRNEFRPIFWKTIVGIHFHTTKLTIDDIDLRVTLRNVT